MSVKLCGGRACCPEMEKKKGKYVITDDFGGKVVLTETEVNYIAKAKVMLDKQ